MSTFEEFSQGLGLLMIKAKIQVILNELNLELDERDKEWIEESEVPFTGEKWLKIRVKDKVSAP